MRFYAPLSCKVERTVLKAVDFRPASVASASTVTVIQDTLKIGHKYSTVPQAS